jgi:hypothetical protein
MLIRSFESGSASVYRYRGGTAISPGNCTESTCTQADDDGDESFITDTSETMNSVFRKDSTKVETVKVNTIAPDINEETCFLGR